MQLYEKAEKISLRLLEKTGYVPETALILGSALGGFADGLRKDYCIDYADIEGFPVSTVPGHRGRLLFGTSGKSRVAVMQGRFHFYEGYSAEEVTLPVRVFQLMGVKNLIVTNAAGGVSDKLSPGDFMVLTDHIGLFCPPVLFGRNDDRLGKRFPDMGQAYDRELSALAMRAAKGLGIGVKSGVYCYCRGPMYETPAEIALIRAAGADAVGMSTVPEVIAAVHAGMRVLGISSITNMAAGLNNPRVCHEEVMRAGELACESFSSLLTEILCEMNKSGR